MMVMNNASVSNEITNRAFFKGNVGNNVIINVISIEELWELCNNAVQLFSIDLDTVVP